MTLADKTVLVLGGTSGIGFAVAAAAVSAGAHAVVVSSSAERVQRAVKALGGDRRARGHALDLTDEGAVRALFEREPSFDHLVFTAGESLALSKLADVDIAAAQRFFLLRYWGAFTAAKHGASRLRPGGSITFTSGLAGARPHPTWSLGASICAAMEGLTRALAVELAPIRVNIIAPGVVKTPLWDSFSAADRDSLYAQSAARLPVGHVGEASEIAEAYLYSMRQTYATGEVLRVDGGGALV